MTFKKGESWNPKGRVPGVPNKMTAHRPKLYAALPGVLDALIQNAMAGDVPSIKLLLERTIPPIKHIHQPTALPITETTPDAEAADLLYQAAIEGEIDPEAAAAWISLIGARRQLESDIAEGEAAHQLAEIRARLFGGEDPNGNT